MALSKARVARGAERSGLALDRFRERMLYRNANKAERYFRERKSWMTRFGCASLSPGAPFAAAGRFSMWGIAGMSHSERATLSRFSACFARQRSD